MSDLNVSRAIVPVVRLGPDDEEVRTILGTAFFVGPDATLVTARHVFDDNPLEPDESLGFVWLPPDGSPRVARVNEYVTSEDHDIAVVYNTGIPGAISLGLARGEVPCNEDVLTMEFSPTEVTSGGAKRHIDLHPYTHKGNVLRHYVSTFPEPQPTRVLYTSFPAMQGASGAPVVRASDFAVVGMLVANLERHLMPAQIVRLEVDDRVKEEIRYFLPMGKALSTLVLQEALASFGVSADVVD